MKKIANTLKFIVFLSIGAALMFFAFRNVDLHKMLNDLGKANYVWVLVSLVFSTIALLSRAHRWGMLIEAADKKPKLSNTFYALTLGYFANLAFPRLGEVTRCTAVYEVEKTPIDSLVVTVIAERVIDLITLMALMVLTILVNVEKFYGFFADLAKDKLRFLTEISVNTWIILALVIIVFFIALFVMRKKLMKIKIVEKIFSFLKGIGEGFRSVLKVKNKGAFLFHSIFIWVMYFISGYIAFFSIPETSGLDLAAALFVLVLGGIGMSAPVNGGIGAYHIIVSSGLVLYGLTIDKGLVYATIVHSSQVLLMVGLGSLAIVMLNIVKRKQLAATETK